MIVALVLMCALAQDVQEPAPVPSPEAILDLDDPAEKADALIEYLEAEEDVGPVQDTGAPPLEVDEAIDDQCSVEPEVDADTTEEDPE